MNTSILAKYTVSDDEHRAIVERFTTHHVPWGDQQPRMAQICGMLYELSLTFLELCPPSRERSVALTHLEEASMWANKSIVINELA